MGILRFLLALSVLLYHTGPLFSFMIANQLVAVCSFFAISGFYMAFILDTKYSTIFPFWKNRALRIFPLYYVILVIIILLALLQFVLSIGEDNAISHYLHYTAHLSGLAFLLETFNFILRNLTLIITSDYFLNSDKTGGYLLVQQAWSLQIELLFYLVVPFILKLKKLLLILFSLLYCVIFYGFIVPLHLIPEYTLTYEFTSYLIFFFLGLLSYHIIFLYIKQTSLIRFAPMVMICFFIYLLFYNSIPTVIPGFSVVSDPLYYILLTICIPFIFLVTQKSTLDRWIGQFSYPVYISHFLVLKIISNTPYFHDTSDLRTIFVILATLGISFLAVFFIENPINLYRQKLREK